MYPFLFRNWLKVKSTGRTSQATGAAAHTLLPVVYRHSPVIGFLPFMGEELATPDALAAVGAFVIILYNTVV